MLDLNWHVCQQHSLNVPSGGERLLSRKSSDVYDNFPCVRVGDYDLPSSMDLRQYLDEMQEVGQWEDDADLPTIPDDEVGPRSLLLPQFACACMFLCSPVSLLLRMSQPSIILMMRLPLLLRSCFWKVPMPASLLCLYMF